MLAFILLAVMVLAMALISCIPGGEVAYGSPLFVAGWGALAVISLTVMVRRRLYRRVALFLFHLAFIVILAGAFATHLWGTSQSLHLRVGQTDFVGKIPVTLVDFRVEYYPGTQAPSDFVSTLEIDGSPAVVAMNRVASAKGYRFYQSSYDSDGAGSVMTVTHDPIGIAVTYCGYVLLFAGMLLLASRHFRGFRAGRVALLALAIAAGGAESAHASPPETLPADVAAGFCSLSVSHGGRVVPLSSLARDFTRRLTGSSTYRGLSAEQVMTGWLFYYDSWKSERCIKIKSADSRRALGIDGRFAAMADFVDPIEGYRLAESGHQDANEQFSLVSQAAAGSLWRLFPVAAPDGSMVWYSPVDGLPDSLTAEQWTVTRHSLNYLAELSAQKRWNEMDDAIDKIARYQHRVAAGALPGRAQTVAERWFVGMGGEIAAPAAMMICGLLLFFCPRRRVAYLAVAVAVGWVALLLLADYVGTGRVPMANGPETMLWLSLFALLSGLCTSRRQPLMLPLGLIVGSLALLVSAIGLRSPQLSPLMPVLRSPLLSVHVLCVMVAYALLALIALCCAGWLCGRRQLIFMARAMLCPAVCMLAAGIFVGAVWANESWGRYWGWDPKEVWALITMLVYCVPLHGGIVRFVRHDRGFAIWNLVAFVCVLMTYFGVNFILGGLHSYA